MLSWHSPFLLLFSVFNYPLMWGERREKYEGMFFGDCPVGLSFLLSFFGESSSSRHEGALYREGKGF